MFTNSCILTFSPPRHYCPSGFPLLLCITVTWRALENHPYPDTLPGLIKWEVQRRSLLSIRRNYLSMSLHAVGPCPWHIKRISRRAWPISSPIPPTLRRPDNCSILSRFQEVVSSCTLLPSPFPSFLKTHFSQVTVSQNSRGVVGNRRDSDCGWLIMAPKDLSSPRPQNL